MIDINLLRTNPEIAKKSQKKRGLETHSIDKILEADKKWRDLKGELDSLRAERNKTAVEIGNLKKSGKNADAQIKKTSELSQSIKDKEVELKELEAKRDALLLEIPNI